MKEEITFILNNDFVSVNIDSAIVLLDFIRKQKHLTGTKEGCKEGDCGACTVLICNLQNGKLGYQTVNSCLLPLGNVNNTHIVTIEGLNSNNLSNIQTEFIKEGASQCGFCTPGFIVSLSGYLINNQVYDTDAALNAIAGNICRCTGYISVKRAINNVLNKLKSTNHNDSDRISFLIENGILPDYFSTVAERLIKLKTEKSYGQHNGAKYIIAGGTDLYVQKPDELLEQEIIFIKNKKLSYINVDGNICSVGATATFEMINNSKIFQNHFPRLKNYFDLIASLPIRNSATVGGNIINASPIGDLTIFFLALNASVVLSNGVKKRKIILKDFYKGYKQLNINNDEFLEFVEFQLPSRDSRFNFEKVSKRTHLDIASVNSAMCIETNNDIISRIHISAGGVAPIPLYLENTSRFLLGKKITKDTLFESLPVIQSEISPINDIRGSAEYKRLLLNQLYKAHFIELFPELINVEELI
ncbi:MAG: FAD binding domain-containing protein [Ignavibacteriaceae bacterium]|nr:FAD binding domain-containing protein [Ignavibacteriaceae bacterium]